MSADHNSCRKHEEKDSCIWTGVSNTECVYKTGFYSLVSVFETCMRASESATVDVHHTLSVRHSLSLPKT